MNSFDYCSPKNIQDTFSLLKEYGREASCLAGGTDLLVRIKIGRVSPKTVIDLKGVPELNTGIRVIGNEVHIGALTTMATLQMDSLIARYFPALVEAVLNIGSVQIRNRASIAGNLCNASPAADSAPSLLIYQAQVACISPQSERVLPLGDFITGPGKTALAKDELVKEIILPIPSSDQAAAFTRLTRRKGVDLATINLCCQVNNHGLTRFVLGAVGPIPVLVEEAGGLLTSNELNSEAKKKVIAQLMEKAIPITDIRASKEYRQAMLTVLGLRALTTALERLQKDR